MSRVVLMPDDRRTARASRPPASKDRSAGWSADGYSIPIADGTLIQFELEFEFRSMLLQHTVRLLFAEAVKRMVTAFEARADQLYGKPSLGQRPPASSTR